MLGLVLVEIVSLLAVVLGVDFRDGVYHVQPGQDIQLALDAAAKDTEHKTVRVHSGTYRPPEKRQALIWLNAKHDGIKLEADGKVILTAANPEIADPSVPSFPACVNHVVYFGDGITRKTAMRGFRITGGNNFVTDVPQSDPIEPRFDAFKKTEGFYGSMFFFTDGAGIKIFGRSYPTLDRLIVYGNFASPCAGGISIDHRGLTKKSVLIQNSILWKNRCLLTGPAIDLLPGSAAEIRNCLFAGNTSAPGVRYETTKGNAEFPRVAKLVNTAVERQPAVGSGTLTVFPGSRVVVDRCTFTANFNGADDKGKSSKYTNSIFWHNTAKGGTRNGKNFELDILNAENVRNCFVHGEINDLRGNVDAQNNTLNCSDPKFDRTYNPQNPEFSGVGYRAP